MILYCPEGHPLPDDYIRVRRWKQPLSSGLVATLKRFELAVLETRRNNVHLTYDMLAPHLKLTHNQHANFQKLRFFALVAKVRDPKGQHISGRWLLTRHGSRFLKGLEKARRYVITQGNRVVEHSEELVHISEFRGKLPQFDSNFEYQIIDGDVLALPPAQEQLFASQPALIH